MRSFRELSSIFAKKPAAKAPLEEPAQNVRLLIGVSHDPAFESVERAWVIDRITESGGKSVGLEIPTDFRNRRMFDLRTDFFDTLEENLGSAGFRTTGLEDPAAWDEAQCIEVAKYALNGLEHRMRIRMDIETFRERQHSRYLDPIDRVGNAYMREQCENALKLLDENPTAEAIFEVWQRNLKRREGFVLERIRAESPHVIVVGDWHARNFAEVLPGCSYLRRPDWKR